MAMCFGYRVAVGSYPYGLQYVVGAAAHSRPKYNTRSDVLSVRSAMFYFVLEFLLLYDSIEVATAVWEVGYEQ